jgi:hypothetical protein
VVINHNWISKSLDCRASQPSAGRNVHPRTVIDADVDVDWRGFGGRDLIPTHRKFPEGARQPRLIMLGTGRKQSTPIIHMRTVRVR